MAKAHRGGSAPCVADHPGALPGRARERETHLLATIVRESADAIIVKDAVGTITEWNPGAERLYGYSAEEAVGHPISILVPDERSGEEIKLLRRALGGAVITQFETERLRRDGNRVEVSLTISPIHDAQGEPAGASVIARDIGERKQAERALCASQEDLRRQSELLAGMIENAPIGMAIVSPKGRWLHVNRSLSEIVGYSEAELLQMSFQEVTHPDDRDSHRAMVEQLLAGEVGSYELEKRYVRKDGEVVWVRLSVSLVRDEHGEPLPSLPGLRAPRRRGPDGRHLGGAGRRAGRLWVRESLRCRDGSYRWLLWNATALEDGLVYATAHDVTESKRIQAELRASREEALEASRLKSGFVANMSHEIRTPLNGVVCMTQLLRGTQLSAEQREYVEVSATSAEALMLVIEDILDFSKIEAGRMEVVEEDLSLEDVVSDVCEIVGPRAREKQLELTYALDEDVPEVLRGDSGRLSQVLMNLVGNAVKFTHEGEVFVSASTDSGGELRIQVRDTGIGISPAALRKLFQPFSQADATTTRRYGGSGLGLCIAKQLVELMGGELDVRSEPGEGSTFAFSLPWRAVTPRPRREKQALPRVRVLIVDDNATNRTILYRLTRSWGMEADQAPDAEAALGRLWEAANEERPYQVALIDKEMPGMDGVALAHAIKGRASARSTRVILLSSSPPEGELGRSTGVDVELLKPVRPSRLYDQIAALLGGAATAGPAPPSAVALGEA